MTDERAWPSPGKLADELESAAWRKGTGRLCTPWSNGERYEYCCLGVMARLAGFSAKELTYCNWDDDPDEGPQAYETLFERGDGNYVPLLPEHERPGWLTHRIECELIDLNDHGEGWDKVIQRLRRIEQEQRMRGGMDDE